MHSVAPLKPPSNIATEVQSALSQQKEEEPILAAAVAAVPLLPAAAGQKQGGPEAAPSESLFQQLFARWSWSYSAVAAALLVLVGLNLFSLTRLQSVQQVQNELISEISRHSAAMVMLTAEDVEELILPAADESAESFVSLFWHPEWDIAVIYAEEFPQLAPEMTYQLWLAADGQRVSGGTFEVNAVGNGTLILRPEQPIDAYQVIGITAEPTGGSPGPTSSPVVRLES